MSLAINILEDLISIPSQIDINKEKNIADYLINLLYKYKFDVKTYEYSIDRPNIVATYKFDREGPTIIFNGHMDTMPAENGEKVNVWKTNPFKATIKDEKIYGFMERCFGNNDILYSKDIDLSTFDAFICLIFATIKKDNKDCFYDWELDKTNKQIPNGKYIIPNLIFVRKEKKNV